MKNIIENLKAFFLAFINFFRCEVKAVLKKEIIHILNDSATLRIAVMTPLIQLTIFGFAINTDVKDLSTYVFDQSKSQISLSFLKKIDSSYYFKIKSEVHSKDALKEALISGQAKIGIIIPPDFSNEIASSEKPVQIQVLVDGSDSTISSQGRFAMLQMGEVFSRELREKNVQGSIKTNNIPFEVRPRLLFNPDSKTAFFVVPGLLGIIIFMVTTMLCCLSIVREKEVGTIDQLLVTPLSPLGLIVGKIIPYMAIGFFDFNLSLFLTYVLFGIPINGSLLLLECAAIIFMLSSVGLSILISIAAATQAFAIQMVMMTMFPSILLSGYVFPFDSMPLIFKILGNCLPVTHFVRISRGVILRGASFDALLAPFLILLCYGTLFITLSVSAFRKSNEKGS